MWAFLRLAFARLFSRPTRGGPMARVPTTTVRLDGKRKKVSAFQLDLRPVNNGEYLVFCQATGAPHAPWMFKPGFSDPEQPVVGLTAAEARRYCRWAGKRLPTEAEWLAAAGPHTYPWGDAAPTAGRACFGKKPGAGAPDTAHRAEGAGPHGHLDLVGLAMEHLEHVDGRPGTVGRGGFWGSRDPRIDQRVELTEGERSNGLGFRAARS